MSRYGMVIDLVKCIGCQGCVIRCKVEHFLPPGIFWARVLMKEYGQCVVRLDKACKVLYKRPGGEGKLTRCFHRLTSSYLLDSAM